MSRTLEKAIAHSVSTGFFNLGFIALCSREVIEIASGSLRCLDVTTNCAAVCVVYLELMEWAGRINYMISPRLRVISINSLYELRVWSQTLDTSWVKVLVYRMWDNGFFRPLVMLAGTWLYDILLVSKVCVLVISELEYNPTGCSLRVDLWMCVGTE